MRKASKNWLGRAVMTFIMGLLVISFGFFGIASWLGAGGQGALAKVGSSEISFEVYRNAFSEELKVLTSQYRRQITAEQARAAGIDALVLNTLMNDLTLDEAAKRNSLYISEDFTAAQAALNANFKGRDGQFDRTVFLQAARQNGYSESGYLAVQGQNTLRQQIVEAVGGGVPAPKTLIDLMNRQKNEERSISFLKLKTSNLLKTISPSDAQLVAYYNDHKSEFKAPEYRKINLIDVSLDDFAGNLEITDDDLRLAYEDAVNAGKLGKVERRTIEQIVFNDSKEAQAVSDRIKAGTSFSSILSERNLKLDDVTLTLQTKAGLADKDVADTVFKLPKGSVSQSIAGVFGFTIARVAAIEPGNVKPYEQVKTSLMAEARQRKIGSSSEIRAKLDSMRDSVEDLRSTGQSLPEIAASLKLKTTIFQAIDAKGFDKNGSLVDILDKDTVLRSFFTANIGVDTEIIRTRNGHYIWFDLVNIEPERNLSFDDAKSAVSTVWTADESNKQMAEISSNTLKKLTDGSVLDEISKSLDTKIEQSNSLTRAVSGFAEAQPGSLLLVQIFSTQVGSYGQARVDGSTDRIIFRVNEAHVPLTTFNNEPYKTLIKQMNALYEDDLVSQFIKGTQLELGATVNQRLLNSAIGVN